MDTETEEEIMGETLGNGPHKTDTDRGETIMQYWKVFYAAKGVATTFVMVEVGPGWGDRAEGALFAAREYLKHIHQDLRISHATFYCND
jgi:hypothetical protein